MSDDTAGPGIFMLSANARTHDLSTTEDIRGRSILGSFSVNPRIAAAPSSRIAVEMLSDDDDFESEVSVTSVESVSRCKSPYAVWLRSSQLAYARGAMRVPYRQQIAIIPLDEDDQPLIGQAVLVRGQDLSSQGISIVHRTPQFYRSFWLAFVEESDQRPVWRAEMKWCRFTRQGHYVSGGKLLHQISTDSELLAHWRMFPDG